MFERRSLASLPAALLLVTPALTAQTPYSGHGAGSVPPEVVKKYAPPALDPEVSRRIQMMLDVRSPGLGAVSPDGSALLRLASPGRRRSGGSTRPGATGR
jgi:hypothetical protein